MTAWLLLACGGGDTGGGIGGTGTSGNDVSVGTITGFGSVWVNGVEFNSSNATFRRDDDSTASQADLRIGMVARVEGSISGASAASIGVDSALKGYVESVSGAQMVVLGQAVITDASTVFENNLRPAQGDYVEVHGLVAGDGQIAAGFVERLSNPAPVPFVVKGVVKHHTPGGAAFSIGNLTVHVPGTATTSNMPSATSWDGLVVEVKGSACAGRPVCGTLTAGKVEPEGVQGKLTQVGKVEVEGFVTEFSGPSNFKVGNQAVAVTGATRFEGGTPADIVLGTKLEVEGTLNLGVLTASKVSLRESIRFEAQLATISGSSLTLVGLPGIGIEANALTRFKDINLGTLVPSQYLRIRARPGSGNNVVATEIEARSSDSRVIIQAVASAISAPTITLLGIVIDTAALSDNQFKDVNDTPIGRSAFFAAAKPGTLIKARGSLAGNTVAWDQEIQLED